MARARKLRHDSEEQGDEMGHPGARGGSSHARSSVPASHRPHKREGSEDYHTPWERECPLRVCYLRVSSAVWGVVVFVGLFPAANLQFSQHVEQLWNSSLILNVRAGGYVGMRQKLHAKAAAAVLILILVLVYILL